MTFVRSATILFGACLSLGYTLAANAALLGRLPLTPNGTDYRAYYDDDLGIMWLADANYAKTSGVNLTGQLNWDAAHKWAEDLVHLGFDDWRLPATLVGDDGCSISTGGSLGTGCTGSELGHMFYTELGGTANNTQTPIPPPDLGKITNLQTDAYWSDTEFGFAGDTFCPDAIPSVCAYDFHFGFGAQAAENKNIGYYAWAVRDGDVSEVPAPGAAWLLGTGLIALVARARRRLASRQS